METSAHGKTPEVGGLGRPPQEPVPTPSGDGPGVGAGADDEVRVTGRGGTWWARVVGRAGRAEARSAPLLLVRFRSESPGATPLEALVAGRSLADVPDDVLVRALAGASEPPPPGRKPPFFEEADGARRT